MHTESAPAEKRATLLEFRNVSASYGPIQALHNVSLSVPEGEIVTLIGANGAGKSTLLMTLFGHPRAHSGDILIAGRSIAATPPHEIARHGVAIVPEGRRIFPAMTVRENLVMGAVSRAKGPDLGLLDEIYVMFPRLKERTDQRAGTLSGGEQQMLAIGRGLMARPRLLLLDEPSLGLAPIIVRQIFTVLEQIRARGTTLFLVEQNANHALRVAQQAHVMVNGRITISGSGQELLANPQVRAAYLGGH